MQANDKSIDQKKLNRQLVGVDKYFNSGKYGLSFKDCVGCLNYWTGVGKTFTAMLILKEYFKTNLVNVVILVPNEPLLKQWDKVLKQNFYKKELAYINVYTADYILSNKMVINTYCLIVDELDAFYSEERFKLLDKTYIRYVDVLGLTASYEDYKNRHKKVETYIPVIDKIEEDEAIKEGYISKYIEYNLKLDLSTSEQEEYDKLSEIIRNCMSKFGKNGLDLAFKCLSGGKHSNGETYTAKQFCTGWAYKNNWRENMDLNNPLSQSINKLWHPDTIFGYSLKLIKSIQKRKELLYNNSAKLETSVKLLQKFKHTKTVVFSQSTVFADNLYGIINQQQPENAVLFHSNVKPQMYPSPKTGKLIKFGKKRLKDRAIERIATGQSKHLITSSVLDRGLNIESLKVGIATSGTQNPTQHQQRSGRVKRINPFDKESVALIINLYIKNSKEVDWLNNRQSRTSNIVYWIDDINEITYKPKIKSNDNIEITDL